MSFLHNLKVFLLALPIFLGIDFLWLGKIAQKMYDREFSSFERTVRLAPAILVYILIPLGLLIFVLPRTNGSPSLGFLYGAVYGAIAYSVYDLTNYAIFLNWSLKVTVIDIVWGAFINAVVGAAMVYISNKIK